jgi:hypothetical protein
VCGVQHAVCGVRCVAFKFVQCAAVCSSVRYRAHGSGWQCGSVCGSVRGSVQVPGSARGSVQLSSGAAVCGSPAVCIFSNKFKIHSYKFA